LFDFSGFFQENDFKVVFLGNPPKSRHRVISPLIAQVIATADKRLFSGG
jgi:hypothetical protein